MTYENLSIIFKLPQSGKTSTIEDKIHESEEKLLELIGLLDLFGPQDHRVVSANIIITANNLILTNQTTVRLSVHMPGQMYELSSKKKSFNSILADIARKKDGIPLCRNIICCANKIRLDNISELMKIFFANGIHEVNCYIDECDKYWNGVKHIIEDNPDVNFYGLTATINKKMFTDQGGNMSFIHQETNHGPEYVGYRDHEIIHIENKNKIETLETILNENENDNANILIIPGRTNDEHKSISETCTLLGVIPIVVNQFGIILYKSQKSKDRVFLNKQYPCKELSEILKCVRSDHAIIEPIAVIASIVCGGRGVTHQSENFLYDIAIMLQNSNNKAELFQAVSRVAHNFKYMNKKCKVYISPSCDKTAKEQEAKIYAINNLSDSKHLISFTEFEKAGKGERNVNYKIIKFKSYEQVEKWFKDNPNAPRRARGGPCKPRGLDKKEKNVNGFYICITQFSKEHIVRTTEEFEKIENWGFDCKKKSADSNKFRVYPVYDSTDDIDSLTWWIVYL